MKSIVVDASVVAKWFLPEQDADLALRLLDGRRRLLAPDLVCSELGNILWKIHRRGELSESEAVAIVEEFLAMPVEIHDSEMLLGQALELAIQTERTVYDCLYLSLALHQNGTLVTADRRFVNSLTDANLSQHVRLLDNRDGMTQK